MNVDINKMVSNFLSWKLPKDFSPDGGISFKKDFNESTLYPMIHEPSGTNLFHAGQAKEMIEFMLKDNLTASNSDMEIELQIQAKRLIAPRITPDRINEVIVSEQYHIFEGTTLTICCLHLQNGFTVTGESACASPDNFDVEIGQKIARDNAKDKIWALEGYSLRNKLASS